MSAGLDRVTEAQVRRELLRARRKASRRRERIGAVLVLALALVVGTLVAKLLFALTDVRTVGMDPVLNSGDVVLCDRLGSPLQTGEWGRGSLALVRWKDNGLERQTIRRVIAVAGDEVKVEPDGHVTVNGAALEEPYAVYRAESEWSDGGDVTPGGALDNPFVSPDEVVVQAASEAVDEQVDDQAYPMLVPEGKLFVLCDNRDNPMDSRSSRFGLVNESDVLGLPRAIIWPIHRASLLTDEESR